MEKQAGQQANDHGSRLRKVADMLVRIVRHNTPVDHTSVGLVTSVGANLTQYANDVAAEAVRESGERLETVNRSLLAEQAAVREVVLSTRMLVFGPEGTYDTELPVVELVRQLADRVRHLDKLHHEMVMAAEKAYMDLARERERAARVADSTNDVYCIGLAIAEAIRDGRSSVNEPRPASVPEFPPNEDEGGPT